MLGLAKYLRAHHPDWHFEYISSSKELLTLLTVNIVTDTGNYWKSSQD